MERNDDRTENTTLKERLQALIGEACGAREIDGETVLDRLAAGFRSGALEWAADGHISIARTGGIPKRWIFHRPPGGGRPGYPSCRFLMKVLHLEVYKGGRVPLGCRNCFKVKVELDRVTDLFALNELSQQVACNSKCGTELTHRRTQSIYSAYFYVDGLDRAFEIMDRVSALIDERPSMKGHARLAIKRGCTSFEMALGPSDQWIFDEGLADVEQRLEEVFTLPAPKRPINDFVTKLGWIETAYSIGDNSYLELTDGKRLYPKTIDYAQRRNEQHSKTDP